MKFFPWFLLAATRLSSIPWGGTRSLPSWFLLYALFTAAFDRVLALLSGDVCRWALRDLVGMRSVGRVSYRGRSLFHPSSLGFRPDFVRCERIRLHRVAFAVIVTVPGDCWRDCVLASHGERLGGYQPLLRYWQGLLVSQGCSIVSFFRVWQDLNFVFRVRMSTAKFLPCWRLGVFCFSLKNALQNDV